MYTNKPSGGLVYLTDYYERNRLRCSRQYKITGLSLVKYYSNKINVMLFILFYLHIKWTVWSWLILLYRYAEWRSMTWRCNQWRVKMVAWRIIEVDTLEYLPTWCPWRCSLPKWMQITTVLIITRESCTINQTILCRCYTSLTQWRIGQMSVIFY